MFIKTFLTAVCRALLLAAGTGLLALGAGTAQAAPASLTCEGITTSTPTAQVGVPITVTANTSGGKGKLTYMWTFSGPATPTSTDSNPVDVTYSNTGTFGVSVHIMDKNNDECTDTTNITVGLATNDPPVANPESYNATDSQTLSVGHPGVLGNDDDESPETLTAHLVLDASKGDLTLNLDGSFTYNYTAGSAPDTGMFTYQAEDDIGQLSNVATVTINIGAASASGEPIARGDTYATPVGTALNVAASRLSGVLYNDFDTDAGGNPIPDSASTLEAVLVSGPTNATSFTLNADGSFNYTPGTSLSDNDNDSFTYQAMDPDTNLSTVTKVNLHILSKQVDYKILMNYELGMHCTGFEFAYCCVLPPYNSILAQVIKPQPAGDPVTGADFPRLLEGDHGNVDAVGRPVVMRDAALDGSGKFQKYFLKYFHDAQPRHEGQGKVQTSTLISAAEGNSLLFHNSTYDSAQVDEDGSITGVEGKLVTNMYEGAYGVVVGDGDFSDPTDNYANGWMNHFYIYGALEGAIPIDPGTGNPTSLESDKIRLGVTGHVEYPTNTGPGLQPLGPTGSGASPVIGGAPITGNPAVGLDNVLVFTGDTGTVVYTQAKVLENLPIMLTSPKIWELLGSVLTPFEDSIKFFGAFPDGPGSVDEDSVRPYVAMKTQLHVANCDADGKNCTPGIPVIGSNGKPVIGHGTAPIDIPNCERCHSVTDPAASNSPSTIRGDFQFPFAGDGGTTVGINDSLAEITDAEKSFWDAYNGILPGDIDWYSRLKAAAINMLALHDFDQGTAFTSKWPACGLASCPPAPGAQNTRLGKDSVICQKCHADNVIAVVKSTCKVDPAGGLCPDVLLGDSDSSNRQIIMPITEAIHHRHRETSECDDPNDPATCGSIDFADAAGRSGGCQGCHPAHRSDGVMDGYPITLGGDNFQANSDNRLAAGGCFVGRDVHSNPMKDVDGAETPAHLNAVGQWLADTVFYNQDGVANVAGHDTRGLWCTNCHTQLGQELWRTEDCPDLINGDCIVNPRGESTLGAVAAAVGVSEDQAIAWLDPNNQNLHNLDPDLGDFTHTIWNPDIIANPDANVATIEASGSGTGCGTRVPFFLPRFGAYACLDIDADGDPSVRVLDFCTTEDCVTAADAVLANEGTCTGGDNAGEACAIDGTGGLADCTVGGGTCTANGSFAFAAPFDAATDGRDHWLAAGEPHCADCHAAPYVEPSPADTSDPNFRPPFNYPRKASLMRYSTGHQGVSCQGCHESIHGLYPVTPTIDSTTYAQAAALNHDGSHGPLKCGTCHTVDSNSIPTWIQKTRVFGRTFDEVVGWAHTYTDLANPLDSTCMNCHGDRSGSISETSGKWLRHSFVGRVGRLTQDKAEIAAMGHVAGDPDFHNNDPLSIADTVCVNCHAVNSGPSDTGAQLLLRLTNVGCSTTWKQHLVQGRLSPKVWEFMAEQQTGSSCSW